MPFSQASFTADGISRIVNVPFPYLDKADVSVTLNGTLVNSATYVWLTASSIQLASAPAAGVIEVVKRNSPIVTPVVVFEAGSLNHRDLNEMATWLLYVTQEAFDLGGVTATTLAGITAYVDAAKAAAAASATAAAGSASSAATSATGASGSATSAASSASSAAASAAAASPGGPGRGVIGGLTVSRISTSNISISGGWCMSDDFTTIIPITNGWQKNTQNAFAAGGAGQGSRKGAGVATNTWYHVFAMWDSVNLVGDILTDVVLNPTLPGTFTKKRRIASYRTDGSGNVIPFVQLGDQFLWATPVADVTNFDLSTTATLFTLTVPTGFQVEAIFNFAISNSSAVVLSLASPDQNLTTANSPSGNTEGVTNSAGEAAGRITIRTNTASQIKGVTNGAPGTNAFFIVTHGWLDTRGRFA